MKVKFISVLIVGNGYVVGTSFVIGDTQKVMEHSRPCTINSFEGQPREKRQITNPENAEVIKGLAQMDGAFVIREDGYIEASGRHFIIDNLVLKIPDGYGTRHSSVCREHPDDKCNRVCCIDNRGNPPHGLSHQR